MAACTLHPVPHGARARARHAVPLRPHSTLHTPHSTRHSGSKRRTQTSSFRAQSRNPCLPSRTHRCCDYAQHDGVCRATLPPSPTPCTRHSAHHPIIPRPYHPVIPGLTRNLPKRWLPVPCILYPMALGHGHGTPCPYDLTPHSTLHTPHSTRHSGSKRRTQTSSFRAQSRNPCLPSRTHRCCDYAQHDGVCRATLPPSPTPCTRHSAHHPIIPRPYHPVIPGLTRNLPKSGCLYLASCTPWRSGTGTARRAPTTSLLTPHSTRHSGSKRRTQTSSFRAQSRNPCLPSRTPSCCDYAQHDGVCRETLPPSPTPCTRHSRAPPHHSAPLPPRHSGLDPESAQEWLPVPCILYPMALGHGHGTPCPYDLTPHSTLLTPTTSLLTPWLETFFGENFSAKLCALPLVSVIWPLIMVYPSYSA